MQALLLLRQHELYIIFDVTTSLDKSGIDVAGCKVDDVEALLQVAHDADYLVVLLLERGDELRHAERRNVELLARQRIYFASLENSFSMGFIGFKDGQALRKFFCRK